MWRISKNGAVAVALQEENKIEQVELNSGDIYYNTEINHGTFVLPNKSVQKLPLNQINFKRIGHAC